MSIEKVRTFFAQYGMENRVLEFQASSATVELAAIAVGVEPARIAKTLSFSVDGVPVLIVAAGDARVSNPKFRDFFHQKAKMLSYDEVSEKIGHHVGGVCPFAIPESVKVYLDISLKRFRTVFPAAGSDNSAIELTLKELEEFSHFSDWVDVCKDWEGAV